MEQLGKLTGEQLYNFLDVSAELHPVRRLNELLQEKLRENIPLWYNFKHENDKDCAKLVINGVRYVSYTASNKGDAVRKVTEIVVRDLKDRSEVEIRKRLGLAERQKIKEIDVIRDELADLRRRCRMFILNDSEYKRIKRDIGKIYPIIDSLEKSLATRYHLRDH